MLLVAFSHELVIASPRCGCLASRGWCTIGVADMRMMTLIADWLKAIMSNLAHVRSWHIIVCGVRHQHCLTWPDFMWLHTAWVSMQAEKECTQTTDHGFGDRCGMFHGWGLVRWWVCGFGGVGGRRCGRQGELLLKGDGLEGQMGLCMQRVALPVDARMPIMHEGNWGFLRILERFLMLSEPPMAPMAAHQSAASGVFG